MRCGKSILGIPHFALRKWETVFHFTQSVLVSPTARLENKGDTIRWFWLETHGQYDQLLHRR
jgi:hypothetical protein